MEFEALSCWQYAHRCGQLYAYARQQREASREPEIYLGYYRHEIIYEAQMERAIRKMVSHSGLLSISHDIIAN
jgi:hypothetical protein